MPTQSAAQKARDKAYAQLQDLTTDTLLDFRWPQFVQTILPHDWKGISTDPIPEKTRITLRVDRDVATFFRKTGPGYQTRMNAVLRMFMLARLAEIIGLIQEPVETVQPKDKLDGILLEFEAMLANMLQDARRDRVGRKPGE